MTEYKRSEDPGLAQHDVRAEEAAQADPSNPAAPPVTDQHADGLDDRTKDELLVEAEARGVEVKTSATKAEILAALRG